MCGSPVFLGIPPARLCGCWGQISSFKFPWSRWGNLDHPHVVKVDAADLEVWSGLHLRRPRWPHSTVGPRCITVQIT